MSFNSFAIRFELNKKEYGIIDKAKDYPFLDQNYLLDLEENEITDIVKKLCNTNNDELIQRFEEGIKQLQNEKNIKNESNNDTEDKMSFKSFAIRFKLNKNEYGIVQKAKKYKFLDQKWLIGLRPEKIATIAKDLCHDDYILQKQFIKGVKQLKSETNNYQLLNESNVHNSLPKECTQESEINDKQNNKSGSIAIKRTRDEAKIEDEEFLAKSNYKKRKYLNNRKNEIQKLRDEAKIDEENDFKIQNTGSQILENKKIEYEQINNNKRKFKQ